MYDNSSSALAQFSIDTTSGQLVLIEPLDREADSVLYLTVTAFDMGEPCELMRSSLRQLIQLVSIELHFSQSMHRRLQ